MPLNLEKLTGIKNIGVPLPELVKFIPVN